MSSLLALTYAPDQFEFGALDVDEEKKRYNQGECAVCLEATCEEQTTSQLNQTEF
jgi:hypothetical protein